MKRMRQMSAVWFWRFVLLGCVGGACALVGLPAAMAQPAAVDYVALAKESSYVIKNFTFANGETLPEIRINYVTWLLRYVSSARIHAAFRMGLHEIYSFSMSYQRPLLS